MGESEPLPSLFNIFLESRPDLSEDDARSIFLSAFAQRIGLKAIAKELDKAPDGVTPFANLIEQEVLGNETT